MRAARSRRLVGAGLAAVGVCLAAHVEACRDLEPRNADDSDGAAGSSGTDATTTRPGTSSSSGGSSGAASADASGSSSSSSGAPPPPFDGGPILPPGDTTVGPSDRPATLSVPTGYAGEPMPLVLLLPGTGDGADDVEALLKLGPTANEKGFFVLRASATDNAFGVSGWNADQACCSYLPSPPDDSAYLVSLVQTAQSSVAVDPKRIFVVGHSGGGFMAYRLACDRADLFAGIVSLAGAADDKATCTPAAPVHVLHMHGDADLQASYTGGSFGTGLTYSTYSYPGAAQSVAIWAGYNGCASALTTGGTKELVAESSPRANETQVAAHGGCPAGASAELWTMQGAGHEPAFDPTFSTQVAEWLLARSKP